MAIGILIGLAGLAGVVIAYLNRDTLTDKPRARQLAPYIAAALIAIGVGVAVVEITAHGTHACGAPGNGSRCSG